MKSDTLSTRNDEKVIDLYRTTGLQPYFEAIYHRYKQRVYRKGLQITKDENLANDCLTRQHNSQLAIRHPLDGINILLDEYRETHDFKLFLLPKSLNTLPTDAINLLIMKDYDGLDLSEIGEPLTVSTEAIKMRLKRSRAKLKKQINSWIEA